MAPERAASCTISTDGQYVAVWTEAQPELEIHTAGRVPAGRLSCDNSGRRQRLVKLNALLMHPSGKHKRKQTNARKSLSRYVVAS